MKAITPIIAIIVLLLITVALAGAGWTYLSAYWTSMTARQIQVVDAFCIGDNQAKVIIKNIGDGAISTGEIGVIDTASGADISDDVQWTSSAGDSGKVFEFKFD
jgi:flagellin-like protein